MNDRQTEISLNQFTFIQDSEELSSAGKQKPEMFW